MPVFQSLLTRKFSPKSFSSREEVLRLNIGKTEELPQHLIILHRITVGKTHMHIHSHFFFYIEIGEFLLPTLNQVTLNRLNSGQNRQEINVTVGSNLQTDRTLLSFWQTIAQRHMFIPFVTLFGHA